MGDKIKEYLKKEWEDWKKVDLWLRLITYILLGGGWFLYFTHPAPTGDISKDLSTWFSEDKKITYREVVQADGTVIKEQIAESSVETAREEKIEIKGLLPQYSLGIKIEPTLEAETLAEVGTGNWLNALSPEVSGGMRLGETQFWLEGSFQPYSKEFGLGLRYEF